MKDPKDQAPKDQANEGEGNRTAARKFDKDERKFVESGKVDRAARDAAKSLDGDEAKDLADAEAVGRSHAAEEDPALKRR